jgi:4-alpha-glucanotransferase
VYRLTPDQKIAGVLAPVFALCGPDDLGIGDTAALLEFGTWAAAQGLRIVQILPVNESGGDNSPYNIISSMALDPTTIATTPDGIAELTRADFNRITANHDLAALRTGPVDYAAVRPLKRALLSAAHEKFAARAPAARRADYEAFVAQQADWLEPYALYRSLMARHDESEIIGLWDAGQRTLVEARKWLTDLPADARSQIDDLADFYRYVQWIAYSQWRDVRAQLTDLGVSLMGDVPVGVSIHSCDVWSEPEAFDLTRSSGAPPETIFQSAPFVMQWGQNWGFPLYDWQAMSRDNFAWWRRRLRGMFAMFDFIRVDHALGFFRIYSFPWRPEENDTFLDLNDEEAKALTGGRLPGFVPNEDDTPAHRAMNKSQGENLFRMMLEETGPHRLIAEDLGSVPTYCRPSLIDLEIPGFKIPQWERHNDRSIILGADYQRLSLACYATHDHPPFRGMWTEWFEQSQSDDPATAAHARSEMSELMRFVGRPDLADQPFDAAIHQASQHALLASNSWLVVPLITDILGTDERFNVPGAIGAENWTHRLGGTIAELDAKFAPEIANLRQSLRETDRLHE